MTLKTQLRRREAADDSHLPAQLPPLLRRLYASRGVKDAQELERGVKGLLAWQKLDGIDAGVTLLQQALADRRRIVIVGDFDADGATSTALAVLLCAVWAAVTLIIWYLTDLKMVMGLAPKWLNKLRPEGQS